MHWCATRTRLAFDEGSRTRRARGCARRPGTRPLGVRLTRARGTGTPTPAPASAGAGQETAGRAQHHGDFRLGAELVERHAAHHSLRMRQSRLHLRGVHVLHLRRSVGASECTGARRARALRLTRAHARAGSVGARGAGHAPARCAADPRARHWRQRQRQRQRHSAAGAHPAPTLQARARAPGAAWPASAPASCWPTAPAPALSSPSPR